MKQRQLILLSLYRLPTETTLYVGDEEAATILNGHQVLWHPAALALGAALPRISPPYDHEEPSGDCIYVLPEQPSLMLAEDWEQRARAAGAIVFYATADRESTFAHLREALQQAEQTRFVDLPIEAVQPFLGIGFGYGILSALFEAMSHENAIASEELLKHLHTALDRLAMGEDPQECLQSAADLLLTAREVVYPVTLYLVEFFLTQLDRPTAGWPSGVPLNVIACGRWLERLAQEQPEQFAQLREGVAAELIEILGSGYVEREEPLFPLESQLWNLRKGQAVTRDLLGRESRVYGRRRFGYQPQSPLLLQNAGFTHALLVAFDDGQLPSHYSIVVNWPSHDGKQIDGFTRTPYPAESAQTYFHLAHHLHQTIMQDQAATLALVHKEQTAPVWYDDWLALSRYAPVLGRRVTLSSYFAEVIAGDYTSATSADELGADYLSERTASDSAERAAPISAFARQARARRRLDAAWTFATILRTLGSQVEAVDGQAFFDHLTQCEDRLELGEADAEREMQWAATALARRLVARGPLDSPGWLILNPCAFKRRVVVELPGVAGMIPTGDHLKACQVEGELTRVVVEVPALGFAWVPRPAAEVATTTTRMRLADERTVRNEFFEAEIDPLTGGLRDLRDARMRIGRLGQQLVWNPGSTMRATQITTTSTGPALGEIVAEGILLDEGRQIATFRQRYRAWLGRPMLELRLEIEPRQPIEGYPWHAYFAARFAWRQETAMLVRSSTGLRSVTTQNRPETPDYLEIRNGRNNVVIFPGGLPFHQRHGSRMLDVLLLCEGETERTFDLGLSLDREQPMQTALGVVSPIAVVETTQGPPHVGATGWLYHLDAPNLLLSTLRPAPDHADGLLATLLECNGVGSQVQFRCVRDPRRARIQDLTGVTLFEAAVSGDAVDFEVSANELLQVRVEFS